MRRIFSAAAVSALVAGTAVALLPTAAQAGGSEHHGAAPVVVVSGLNNPRQLSLVDGQLLVAEAGSGGPTCGADGPEGPFCIGATGSVSLVRRPWVADQSPHRIITGLLSAAGPDGSFAVGSDGVSARGLGAIYVQITYAPPEALSGAAGADQSGQLLKARSDGRFRPYADISAVEQTDPDGQGIDSDPYAVLALPGRQLVADAAGNDILEVRNGHVRVWAVLPDHDGNQAVPTSLAVGPHGTIYVGELNGENPGTARVYRFAPNGRLLGWTGGFTTVTGVAVGGDGTLYVSELFADQGPEAPPGQVTTVRRGSRTSQPVPFPAGLAVDDHHLYVSAWSIADADGADLGGFTSPPGQVWRLHA
jgi:hypothetical protein